MFGSLVGLLGLTVIVLLEYIDLSAYAAFFETFPEGFFDFIGGIVAFSTPYGFVAVELFTFMGIFVGIYLVYIASSTALPNEVENKTIDLILSKPIRRSSYLAGKIGFLYLYIAALLGIVVVFIGAGMATSPTFIEYGLHWNRLLAVYAITFLHLGTLAMTALLFATVFLDTKKTMGTAIALMFLMFFIGTFWEYLPQAQQGIRYTTTWYYYNATDVFGLGLFDNLLRDILVLGGVNAVLLAASLLVFRRRDIPV
jgi:ABC-2 type transport system permease protein